MEKKIIALPNGETYAYLEQGAEYKAEGKTILLLHGNSASSVHFMPLFRRLTGVHLVAPDIRGFGDSSYNERFSSLSELADDIKLFADALGISRVCAAGLSAGGIISFELAVKYPQFVTSLFIIQGGSHKGIPYYKTMPGGSFDKFTSKEDLASDPVFIARALHTLEKKNAFITNLFWKKSIYVNKKPPMKDNKMYIAETLKQRNLVDLNWALIHFNMSEGHNGYAQGTGTIKDIKCPVTFTCAALDKIVPPAIVMDNAAAISGSSVLEYKQSGHSPLVDCPDQLAADILEHVKKHE
ncbi:MAG: alpha/beta hydrolase [Treponema sp.]|nr:alpha/beta hydrolase [Treponema sp.]